MQPMQQPQYSLPQTETATTAAISAFFSRVYTWMALGLALTGAIAAYVSSRPDLVALLLGKQLNFFLLIGATLGLVMAISWGINKISAPVATGLFLLYAALNGILFSSIFLVYTGESIAKVFFITGGTFGVMSIYGFVTKTDLTRVGQIAFMGLIGVIIASIANWFFKSSTLSYIISYVGVAVFVALTAYDTQKLKHIALQVREGSEGFAKASIIGALTLYLDFINLFLLLLRLFGRRR